MIDVHVLSSGVAEGGRRGDSCIVALQEWVLSSALHIAAYNGDVAKLQELLSACKQ